MKQYVQAESLEKAYALRKKDKKNTILGGNLWLKMGKRAMNIGIDLCNLSLDQIEEDENEYRIGCMCSLRDLEIHESLQKEFQGSFKAALCHIVGVQFRNTATVGGSVFPRFGFSDVLTILAALDSYVELYHAGVISMKEFIEMKPDDDVLVRVIIKKDGRNVNYQTHRMTETDFGILNCAVAYKDGAYTVVLGATPYKAQVVDCVILSDSDNNQEIDVFCESVVEKVRFGTNMRGSAQYRKAIAKVLIKRAIVALHA